MHKLREIQEYFSTQVEDAEKSCVAAKKTRSFLSVVFLAASFIGVAASSLGILFVSVKLHQAAVLSMQCVATLVTGSIAACETYRRGFNSKIKRQNKIRKLALQVGDDITKEVGVALEDRTITSSEFESILNKRRLYERSATVIMTGSTESTNTV